MHSASNPRRILVYALTLFWLAYLAWALRNQAGITQRTLVDSAALIAAAILAALICSWMAWRAQQARLRLAWIAFTLAALAIAFDGLRAILQHNGFPTTWVMREPVRLGALALLGVGLLVHPRLVNTRLNRAALILDLAVAAFAVIFLTRLALAALFNAITAIFPLALVYPILGLLLLLTLLMLFLSSDPRHLPIPPIWLALAIVAFSAAALAQPLWAVITLPQAGRFLTLPWLTGCLLLAVAALGQGAQHFPFIRNRSQVTSRLARAQRLTPYALTLALGLLTLANWAFFDIFRSGDLLVTVLLVVAILVRRVIQAGQIRFERYASLVDSIAEPAFVCEETGLLRLVNPALLGVTGFPSAADLLGQPLSLILDPQTDAAALVTAALARPADPNDTRPIGWSGETMLRRRDGAGVPVYLSLRPVHALPELGEPRPERLALAGTAHELTRQKRQQAALQQAYEQVAAARAQLETLNAELEQKVAEETANLQAANLKLESQNERLMRLDQMKSDFVSLVSHELRAPLTNINGGIELVLSRRDPPEPGIRRNLELVQSEIKRLTRFVETILDLSALDAGRMPLYMSPISFENLISVLQGQMVHRPGVERLRWHAPPDLPSLLGDEQALASVLFHLVDNAMKYAPQGEITIFAEHEDGAVRIRVSDNGPGIPPAELPLLFDRFYRSDNADSHTVYGHGLGLYIVRRMVEGMGGRVQAGNNPGGGAVFTCWLPAADQFEEHHAPKNSAG